MLTTHKFIPRSITWHLSQVKSLINTSNALNAINSCYAVFTFGCNSTAQYLIFLYILICMSYTFIAISYVGHIFLIYFICTFIWILIFSLFVYSIICFMPRIEDFSLYFIIYLFMLSIMSHMNLAWLNTLLIFHKREYVDFELLHHIMRIK